MKSINISYSKLSQRNFYYAYTHADSNLTHSTFSNNTTLSPYNNEAYHTGSSYTHKFRILFCNYIANKCNCLIYNGYILHLINCSFSENNIEELYFESGYDSHLTVIGCNFDTSNPSTEGDVIITENANPNYPKNRHLSSSLCDADLKLEFPDDNEIKTKIKEIEEIKISYKQNNNFNIFVWLVFLVSK